MSTKAVSPTGVDPSVDATDEGPSPSVRSGESTRLDSARGVMAATRGKLGEFNADESAQVGGGTNIVRLMIGVAVAVLVGVGVAVPIINDVIADGNLSGVEETIASFISTIIILVIFMAAASPIMGR